MSQTTSEPTSDSPDVQLEQSTYEIIRKRLKAQGEELRQRLNQLNNARRDVFGSIETKLLSNQRITTEHNCVPRDIVPVGQRFIFGYNVQFGLKTETSLADVFAVQRFDGKEFHADGLELLEDPRFLEDFRQLYKYYKHTSFAKFQVIGVHLFMVFRVGKNAGDTKSFKWRITGETLEYLDNRSDHEVVFPAQHEYEWVRTHRDLHRSGRHPHISIEDRVFVETVGGDLTIKVEDNTEDGEGIYSEPVDDPDQVLDDAEIFYALVGNLILLKIKPYKEKEFRYIVFNEKNQSAIRLDALHDACVLLPEDHGLIFSNGYYLQTGEFKTFDNSVSNLLFEKRVPSPNGEDHLYVFYNQDSGDYVLLSYNMITQQVATPILCNGFSYFEDGKLVLFRSDDTAQKHHALQIWQTPFVGQDFQIAADSTNFLFKIGNRDIVRAMAESHEVLGLIEKEDSYANLYVDLVRKTTDILDTYFWLNDEEAFRPGEVLHEVKLAATSAVDEFDKVVRVRRNTSEQTQAITRQANEVMSSAASRMYQVIDDFVVSLSDLRRVRGEVISLKDLKYVDVAAVEQLEAKISEAADRLSRRCVDFLLREDSLEPYLTSVSERRERIEGLEKATEAKSLDEELAQTAAELELLIEIVSNLKIDDATQRTRIIDSISAIYSQLNQTRASLRKKTKELLSVEGVAEFNSQMKLLSQAIVNYLDVCDSPERCDEYLTKMMVQVEELEGRFAEFDEFVVQLAEKREEIYAAFDSRRLALVEARNQRASALMTAADRILNGIRTRVSGFQSINEINSYFASDLMIDKVRDIVRELEKLEDSVKVDDIQSRMKSIREDTVRQLRDRQELFADGENVIKFGKHRFSVNVQDLELTSVIKEESQYFHLTGTKFFERIESGELDATRSVWKQELVSEDSRVYRGEYLAFRMLREGWSSRTEIGKSFLEASEEEQVKTVQGFMGRRYSEGYVKGVHDHDGARILTALLKMDASIGNLRYPIPARALARVFWHHLEAASESGLWEARIRGAGRIQKAFSEAAGRGEYLHHLANEIREFAERLPLFDPVLAEDAAGFLFDELAAHERLSISHYAAQLCRDLLARLERRGDSDAFQQSVDVFECVGDRIRMLVNWVSGFQLESQSESTAEFIVEAAAALLEDDFSQLPVLQAETATTLTGLVGNHVLVEGEQYVLDYNEFLSRLEEFQQNSVPRFNAYLELKKQLLEQKRQELRLSEFKPRVLTSFVRNRLIDEVYLPLIGDNLAKQIGVVGEDKRTDLMGLLLLISPPGYGKTTLMEYVANRLGLTFMKINGPAIGHQVTSLDPAEAPNASAREEVEKLNLALEMGDNVMIYLDDIQHCNPEFLQKFISLCDGSRRIEGVYRGVTRTYDLRGRKVCVVMAGNPYTESGSKFQIPDMLANRADTYNLGDVVGESAESFELSYLENCLTSNRTLQTLQSRSRADLHTFIQIARDRAPQGYALEANYSTEEVNDIVAVFRKLLRARDVLLKVNGLYIESAAQADEYRTEPPFKLQGSYRDMNKLAERVVPIMNEEELDGLIMSHFENQAQTLTSGAEANLLRFKQLLGWLSEEETQRWEDIRRTFKRNLMLGGAGGEDRLGQVIAQMTTFSEGLYEIQKSVDRGAQALSQATTETHPPRSLMDPEQLTATHLASAVQLIGELGAKLGGIEQAISQKEASKEVAPQVVEPSPEFDAALVELRSRLATLEGGLAARISESEASPAAPVNSNIQVVTKVPKQFLDVIKAQFTVMQHWFDPLLDQTSRRSEEVDQLRKAVEESKRHYQQLLKKIESDGKR